MSPAVGPSRAAVLRNLGDPPRAEPLAPPPPPRPDEVVVAMKLAPINPADLLTIEGRYSLAPELPFVLGAEGVGEVVGVGAGVSEVTVGDHVLPLSRGNWAGVRTLRADDVLKAPAGLPLEQLAMLRINAATTWRLLDQAKLEPGDWLIQNAAGSAVAQLVRLLARKRGLRVVDVVREETAAAGHPWPLVDGPDLAARVGGLVAGASVKLALDCVAGDATGRLAACLAPAGTLVVFGHLSGRPCEIPSALLTGRQLVVRGFSLRPAEAADTRADMARILEQMADLLRPPAAHLVVRAVLGLSELDAALALARSRGAGRVLLALDR